LIALYSIIISADADTDDNAADADADADAVVDAVVGEVDAAGAVGAAGVILPS